MATEGFSARWALRMRVSMSAIGSVMLMLGLLPARLDHARDLAVQRDQPQLPARQPELAVNPARAPGQRAAVPQPHRRGVARQLLQLLARRVALLDRQLLVIGDLQKLLAPRCVLLDGFAALVLAVDHGGFCHTD